jgi:hypothetical protein
MNNKIAKLLHEGFSMTTLEGLNEKQLSVLFNKIVSEQPKPIEKTVTSKVIELPTGAKTALGGATVSNEAGKTVITTTPTEGEMTEDSEDSMDFEKGQRTQDKKQVGPSTDDGSNEYGDGLPAESNIQEKAVSKQQQKIMGLALSVKRGDTPKSKVSKQVQKMAKEMTKKELEDFASTKHKGLPKTVDEKEEVEKLEESILRIIENHLPPHTTKGELLNYIRRNK